MKEARGPESALPEKRYEEGELGNTNRSLEQINLGVELQQAEILPG